jgi:hypothetical protein
MKVWDLPQFKRFGTFSSIKDRNALLTYWEGRDTVHLQG